MMNETIAVIVVVVLSVLVCGLLVLAAWDWRESFHEAVREGVQEGLRRSGVAPRDPRAMPTDFAATNSGGRGKPTDLR